MLKFLLNGFLSPKDKCLILDWADLVINLLSHISEEGNNVHSAKAGLKHIIQDKIQPVTQRKSKDQGI